MDIHNIHSRTMFRRKIMTKRTDCKRYEIIPNVGIQDNLTGEILITLKDCTRHLNQLNKKNDELVERFYQP